MCTRLALVVIVLVLCACAPARSQDAPPEKAACAPRDAIIRSLDRKYGERVEATALAHRGSNYVELLVSETGSWTLVSTDLRGIACLIASGTDWQTTTPVPFAEAIHGSADWIARNPATSFCCGPQDCHEIDNRFVRYDPGPKGTDGAYVIAPGWRAGAAGFVWIEGRPGSFHSINGNYWACIPPDGNLKCFFAPVMGS